MIGITALALMTAASAQAADPALGRIWPGLAAQQVGRCGFASVALSYDGLLGEYIVTVPGIQDAPDEQLRCAAEVSLKTDYYISFRNPLNRRYEAVYWPVAEGQGRAGAREWLAKRGLLSKLPPYDSGKTDALAYARKLEALCGTKGAFAVEQGALTLKAGSAGRPRLDTKTVDCLMNAQWASGLPTGFAGEQYYPAHP
jgi:hypothetical protein